MSEPISGTYMGRDNYDIIYKLKYNTCKNYLGVIIARIIMGIIN